MAIIQWKMDYRYKILYFIFKYGKDGMLKKPIKYHG